MKELGPIVEQMLRRYSLWHSYQQYLLIEKWSSIVGPGIATVTRADNINKGVLLVTVQDSVWLYHLSFLKPQLISKLNQHVGSTIVKDIQFKIGVIEERKTDHD